MEKLKFTLVSIVVLFVLALVGYWAVSSMQSGGENKLTSRMAGLEEENEDLKDQVKDLTNKLLTLESELEKDRAAANQEIKTDTPAAPATYKNQNLINELQKLVDDKIYMKLKSSGSRVGTVQKFLNIYNKTSNKVDNDYGEGTRQAVLAFQKDQGIVADGEAGPGTFGKMIEWLKKQG